MASGAAAVPIPWTATSRQIAHILRDTGASHVVSTAGALHRITDSQAPVSVLTIEELVPGGRIEPAEVQAHALALVLYTSGSTGAPRGVMASHANLWASVRPVARYLGLTARDRVASLLPFSFTYGLSQLTCALAVGAELIVVDPTIPQDAIEALRFHRCTVVATIPPAWLQLTRGARLASLVDLRVATCAGGRMSPELVAEVRRTIPHAALFLMYGFTEVFRSAWLSPDEVDAHPDAMGRAIEGARIELLDANGRPCEDGEIGELVHAGPTVTQGYWNNPQATRERYLELEPRGAEGLPERAARSGDLVRRSASGLLYFVGRKDYTIKTLGIRVSPDEVSDALVATSLVREAAVTGEPDALRGQRVVAHVVLREDATMDELRRRTAQILPRYMLPARWVQHDQLPRTAVGKYDLKRLWQGDG